MATTILLDTPTPQASAVALRDAPAEGGLKNREPLLREALGMSLRAYRADKGVSLRELSTQALVSPGYLSELERGRKEVSSEDSHLFAVRLERRLRKYFLKPSQTFLCRRSPTSLKQLHT